MAAIPSVTVNISADTTSLTDVIDVLVMHLSGLSADLKALREPPAPVPQVSESAGGM